MPLAVKEELHHVVRKLALGGRGKRRLMRGQAGP